MPRCEDQRERPTTTGGDEDDMSGLPDLDTIDTMLGVVEGRDPTATSVSRFDEDHEILLSTQSEIGDALTSELSSTADKDRLRVVLDRIENDIDANRNARGRAAAAEAADRAE